MLPRLSLDAESVDYSLVAGHRLPIVVVSLVEHGLWVWASVLATPCLYSTGLVIAAHGLSCSVACGVYPEQGLNACIGRWILYH